MAKRRSKKKDAHHGGAWKVAFADFMTAMMAFFLVMWISAQDEKILIATSHYFKTPFTSMMENTAGVLPFDTDRPARSKGEEEGNGLPESGNREVNLQLLNSMAKDFFRLLNLDDDVGEKPIDIQVTSDGMRITLYDRARHPLFVDNTAEFTEWGRFVMQSLAWMVDRQRFHVVIEGHTRSGLVLPKPDYTPWELSADRANAARRALTFYAVDEELVERVTGYAGTRPLPFQEPESESNQRVTLSLTVQRKNGKSKAAEKAPAAERAPSSVTPPAASVSPTR